MSASRSMPPRHSPLLSQSFPAARGGGSHEENLDDSDRSVPTRQRRAAGGRPTEVVELADGGRVELRIAPVTKQLGDATVRMLAYNGSIPGPTLRVRQGSEIDVDVVNEGDLDATVHWHGLRLDNRFDGTHETQAPIPVGGRFTCRVTFPDPGRLLVPPAHPRGLRPGDGPLRQRASSSPPDPDYWGPAHRELVLTLDDILLEDGQVAPFSRVRDQLRGDGPLRQRAADRRRAGARADRASRARSCAST